MNFTPHGINKGKVVYFIDNRRFENTQNKRDGREKAEKYCLDNFLNPNDIQKFDSRTECDRYEYLLAKQEIGEVSSLGHHFTLRIQDEFVNANGDQVPAITYEADFIYKQGETRVVEDVKGSEYFIDERFITIKQVFDRMMKDKGLYIKVVMLRNKEWIEWHLGEKKKSQKLVKKQREEIKTNRALLHEKEIAERKTEREKARYRELAEKEKLSKAEQKRLDELRASLTERGIML